MRCRALASGWRPSVKAHHASFGFVWDGVAWPETRGAGQFGAGAGLLDPHDRDGVGVAGVEHGLGEVDPRPGNHCVCGMVSSVRTRS